MLEKCSEEDLKLFKKASGTKEGRRKIAFFHRPPLCLRPGIGSEFSAQADTGQKSVQGSAEPHPIRSDDAIQQQSKVPKGSRADKRGSGGFGWVLTD